MCQCDPRIRTPFCGKPGCERPEGAEESDHTPLPVYIPEMTLDLVNKQRREIEKDAHETARLLGHLTNLRQAARRVVDRWGAPDDPLIHPDMGAAVEALKEAVQETKPPFPGTDQK